MTRFGSSKEVLSTFFSFSTDLLSVDFVLSEKFSLLEKTLLSLKEARDSRFFSLDETLIEEELEKEELSDEDDSLFLRLLLLDPLRNELRLLLLLRLVDENEENEELNFLELIFLSENYSNKIQIFKMG